MADQGPIGDGARRFNPPPGWPVPPSGWEPPPGWQPDPSWPAPPIGWQFWITAEPSKFRKRLVRVIQVAAATITLAATIIATVIAISDRPEPYTMEDWQRKANATCEQDFGALHTPVLAVLPLLAQAMASTPPEGTQSETLTEMAKTIGETAFAFRKLSGDLRGLDLPDEHDAIRIDRLLNAAGEVSASLTAVATFVVNYQIGKATLVDGQAAMTGLQTAMTTSLPTWYETAGELGLDQCQAIVGNPGAAGASLPPSPGLPTPSNGELSAAQSTLVQRLNTQVLVRCTPNAAEENANVVAAVTCEAAKTGLSKRPLVIQFGDRGKLDTWIDQFDTGRSDAQCKDGGYRNTWEHESVTVGLLLCNKVTDGIQFIWSFPDDNVVVLADATDGQAGYTWWTENAYLLVSP